MTASTAPSPVPATARPLTPARRVLAKVFTGLAALLVVSIVVQFTLAATGAYSGKYEPHHALNYGIFSLMLVLAIVAAPARLWRPAGLALLAALLDSLQIVIVEVAQAMSGSAGQVVFALHGVNALAIMGVAVLMVRKGAGAARG